MGKSIGKRHMTQGCMRNVNVVAICHHEIDPQRRPMDSEHRRGKPSDPQAGIKPSP